MKRTVNEKERDKEIWAGRGGENGIAEGKDEVKREVKHLIERAKNREKVTEALKCRERTFKTLNAAAESVPHPTIPLLNRLL